MNSSDWPESHMDFLNDNVLSGNYVSSGECDSFSVTGFTSDSTATCTGAKGEIMRVITTTQHSIEWFAARLGVPSASRFDDFMPNAKGKYKEARRNYAIELCLERLTGKPAQHYENTAMQWGTDNESQARIAYSQDKLTEVAQTGFVKHHSLDVGCSPDGLIGTDGLLEIKCPFNSAKHLGYILDKALPDEYKWQVLGQLFVIGRKWCDFVSFDPRMPEKQRLFVYRATLTDEDRALIEKECGMFLEYVDEMMRGLND